jgi:hypothetical protein
MTLIGDPVRVRRPWDYALGAGIYERIAWIVLAALLAKLLPRVTRPG